MKITTTISIVLFAVMMFFVTIQKTEAKCNIFGCNMNSSSELMNSAEIMNETEQLTNVTRR